VSANSTLVLLFISTNFAGMRLELLGNDYDNNVDDNKLVKNWDDPVAG